MKSTKLFLDNLNLMNGKTPLSLVSPIGQFTSRGKTAQTGRADNTAGGTLPDIDSRYDRPSSNNRNGFLHKKVNNLFNQGKEQNNTRYGNLLKGQTIDLLQQQDDAEMMKDKNFAGIRVNKLGKKKLPDKYSKSLNTAGAEDIESIPSDIENDQWAEINKYDYELYMQQQREKKEEYLMKRNMVRNTLEQQLNEQKVEKQKNIEYNQKMD